jgi:hypothetical protein
MHFNRPTESFFYGYGIDVQHIAFTKPGLPNNLSVLARLKILGGKRVAPKLFGINWYTSITLNAYFTDGQGSLSPNFLSHSSVSDNLKIEYWPGISFGLLVH